MIGALMIVVFACNDDESIPEGGPFVEIADADKSLVFTNAAGEKTFIVKTNRSIDVVSTESVWCMPTVMVNADKSVSVKIAVPRNVYLDKRNAKLILTTKNTSDAAPATVEIEVEQAGFGPFVSVAEVNNVANFTDVASEQIIAVTTNCELNAVSTQPTWCRPTLITEGGNTTLKLAVDKNATAGIRTATVSLSTKKDPSVKVEIRVSQAVFVRELWESCESLTGFNSVNLTMELDEVNPQQGKYSLKMTTGAGVWLLYKSYATPYDATPYNHIHFDLYISSLTATPPTARGYFEISSAGIHDKGKRERWPFSNMNLQVGWNHIKLLLGSGTNLSDDIDYSALNYFRIAHEVAPESTEVKIDNIRFTNE
jgi:hypothetical protein